MTKELTRRSFLKTGIGGTAAGLAAFSLRTSKGITCNN